MSGGLDQVLARIGEIQQLFGTPPAQSAAGAQSSAGFSAAMSAAGATSSTPATGGTAGAPTAAAAASGATSGGQSVVADAKRYLGIPYLWGGTNPAVGLDCSGLVQLVFKDLGVTLPRVAADQAHAGVAVPDLASAQPGDLVTFGSPAHHIGIYLGNGQMIDAPYTGVKVRIEPVGNPTSIRRVLPAGGATVPPSSATITTATTAAYRPAALSTQTLQQVLAGAGLAGS